MVNAIWMQTAGRANVTLSDEQGEQLSRYLDLLTAGNGRMNLTRIVDRPTAELQHVADALTLLPLVPAGPASVADVGSGGGVPGIPLAIARPDAAVTLIEATKKKAAFLRETVAALGLSNVTVVDDRVETAGRGELRERFDVAVARAVATLDWLAEWCLPLVRVGGVAVAMKGPRAQEELPGGAFASRVVGGGSPEIRKVELPGTDGRVLVVFAKRKPTGENFPRPVTSAKGKPLQLRR